MKSNKLIFTFVWKTCRDTPFLEREEILGSLTDYFLKTRKKSGVVGWGAPQPNEIEVTIETNDVSKAPSQIFWELSRATAVHLVKKFPDLKKLPSVWTRSWTVRTKGKA